MPTHPSSDMPAGCQEPIPGRGSVQTTATPRSLGRVIPEAGLEPKSGTVRLEGDSFAPAGGSNPGESGEVEPGFSSNADASGSDRAGGLSGTETRQG